MYILGISCFYHESAACLIQDGAIVAATTEERFTRKKHDSDFPSNAVAFCLETAGITIDHVDRIVFYEKPFWKFHRILLSTLTSYPWAMTLFSKAMITWLTDKLWTRSILAEKLHVSPTNIFFVPHHLSHAAASFYPSGFQKAAILTADGVGEWTTTTMGKGEGNNIQIFSEMRFPHSLGLLYSTFTAFLGFEVNDGEYKVMGMAPYGKPTYLTDVKKLVDVYADGSFHLKMDYFSFHRSADTSYAKEFVKLFGTPRPPGAYFFTKDSGYPKYFGKKPKNYNDLCAQNQHYADIAASIQTFTEEILLMMAKTLHAKTKLDCLCIGGGVALNSVANGSLLRESPFKRIFVQPAAGDDGAALGAALYTYHTLLKGKKRQTQTTSYFGAAFSAQEIEHFLTNNNIPFTKKASEKTLIDFLAKQIARGRVIGFFHGRAEWGPRALGSRSILADPRREAMKEIVNTKIKFREPYRPFAPVVLAQAATTYFDLGKKDYTHLTNFMLGVFPVKKSKRGIIPAVTHIDGSARPQIISAKQNARYYGLVKRFGQITGVPVLLNTSFNLKGEPVVNSPQDAFRTFAASGLDILALENYIVFKEDIR